MDLTYQIAGGDGKVYGPVNLEEMKSWIREGRVTADTRTNRSDQLTWAPASQYPELGLGPGAASAAAAVSQPAVAAAPPGMAAEQVAGVTEAELVLEKRVKSGGSWFYWIAALSLVNSIAALTGSDWRFVLGLGITDIISLIAKELSSEVGSVSIVVAAVLNFMALALFVALGIFSCKKHRWAFIVGMVLFALDGLLLLLFMDFLSVGFHVLALYFIFKGFQACREWYQWKADTAGQT